jgi:uncharacterized membrane protein YuzA (DUF378 family)
VNSITEHRNWWLLIILTIATALRLYHLDFSFSNDELSALTRTRFDNFSDLISKGVNVDFHPAFAQVFLYFWSTIFGISEFTTRFPFVLMGVASVFVIYLLGKEMSGEKTGLLSAALAAVTGFFILYSQLARPYSPGLLFTLLAAWGWIRIIKHPHSNWNIALATIATALAMYTHYFSFMTCGIIWLALLPMLNKFNWKSFGIASIITGMLFLPHLQITLLQLSYGGVGSWLGAPEGDFLKKFLLYVFNDSLWLGYTVLVLFIVSIFLSLRFFKLSKWHLFSIAVFVLPFIIGYYYSVHINPVLQYSTLLFATPFLFFVLFSFFGDYINVKFTIAALLIVIVGGLYSTIWGKKHYEVAHFAVFRELAESIVQWDEEFGEDQITKVASVHGDYYLDYYFKRMEHEPNIVLYELQSDSALQQLNQLTQNSSTKYFALAWSNIYVTPETYEMVMRNYPHLIDYESYFNSGVYLFSKEPSAINVIKRTLIFDSSNIIKQDLKDSISDYVLQENQEFSKGFEGNPLNMGLNGNEHMIVQATVSASSTSQLTLVFEYNSTVNEKIWYGSSLNPIFFNGQDNGHQIILSRKLDIQPHPDDKLSVYLWKTSPDSVIVHSLEVKFYKEFLFESPKH